MPTQWVTQMLIFASQRVANWVRSWDLTLGALLRAGSACFLVARLPSTSVGEPVNAGCRSLPRLSTRQRHRAEERRRGRRSGPVHSLLRTPLGLVLSLCMAVQPHSHAYQATWLHGQIPFDPPRPVPGSFRVKLRPTGLIRSQTSPQHGSSSLTWTHAESF